MCRDRQQYMMEELNRLSRLETKRNEYNILMEKKLVSVSISLCLELFEKLSTLLKPRGASWHHLQIAIPKNLRGAVRKALLITL